MEELIVRKVHRFLREKQLHRRWTAMFLCLALLVSGGALSLIMLPGEALTRTQRVLICGYDSTSEQGNAVHYHNAACYNDDGELICTLPEGEAHVHTADCYDEDGELICTLPEGEPHVHSDACYVEIEVPADGPDSEADLEDEDDWAVMFAQLDPDAPWDETLVTAVKTQLGYRQSERNYVMDENGTLRYYTRYGAWNGSPYAPWSALFVSFCLHFAGIPEEAFARSESPADWVYALATQQLYTPADGVTPRVGDLVFFDPDGDVSADLVGVIVRCYEDGDAAMLETVEGGREDAVSLYQYRVGDPQIMGYGRLPVRPDTASQSQNTLSNALVSVSPVSGEALPEDAVLAAQELTGEDAAAVLSRMNALLEEAPVLRRGAAEEAGGAALLQQGGGVGSESCYAVFDISLDSVDASAYDGGFLVELTLPEPITGRDPQLYHLGAEGVEALDAEYETVNGYIIGVRFVTDSFSPFVVSYTVDFSYEGYTFSINGGSTMLLSELLTIFDVECNIAQIVDVEFSDPTLLQIVPLEGDWQLVSLASFTSEQTLTLTLADGSRIVFTVTDAIYTTDLEQLLDSAELYEEGVKLPWPATVRENRTYTLRLIFKEDSSLQFIDSDEWMIYELPAGLLLGHSDFEKVFTMDVGNGVKLENNIVHYDAALNQLQVQWNTADLTAFNKLKASNSAEFHIDLTVSFTFDPDDIEFSQDVHGKVIKDTSYEVTVDKTGEYNQLEDRIDYTVTVASYGNSQNVTVTDALFGTALTYLTDDSGTADFPHYGLTWRSNYDSLPGHENNITLAAVQPANGFALNVGQMLDGEVLEFSYSAAVDYDMLTGAGTYDETFNKVVVEANGNYVEAEYQFEGELRYVALGKTHRPISWSSDPTEPATVNWTVRVNNDFNNQSPPKVGMAGTQVSDRIYAGDVENMEYSGDGLTVKVYEIDPNDSNASIFVGEYEVPWSALTVTDLSYDVDTDEYQYASWSYTFPQTQVGEKEGQSVVIDNTRHYYYDITYTTDVVRAGMFEGYIGNEAQEYKTGTLKQDGFYPPGTGTAPEVTKEAIRSDEDYIYWEIHFDRQSYELTRCVIEDDNPTLYGKKEPVDVSTQLDGSYEYLWVTGLRENERWEVASATETRTTFKFYRDAAMTKPGLGKKNGSGDDVITIHLRTKNNADWIEGTMTRYWPRDHVNTVTWIANAHQAMAQASEVPDIRRIEKRGVQVGTILRDGVQLPVFRFELFFIGMSDVDFAGGAFVVNDYFNTDYLAFLDIADLTREQVDGFGGFWYWDQQLKGFSRDNHWVGPVPTAVTQTASGLQFSVQETDFMAVKPNGNIAGLEPGTTDEYCLRYSMTYYLVVKDAAAAQALAALANSDDPLPAGLVRNGTKINFTNTASWDGTTLASSTDVAADFDPMSKSIIDYDENTDTATYQVVINPQRLRLNEGRMIRVEDSYRNLAVDFSTVSEGIVTVPASAHDRIDWAYHNNTGVFWIPDETMVVITYKAQPIGDPGMSASFSNTLRMLDQEIVVDETQTLSSESEGSAGDYNIRLFKYQDNSMNLPLEGAIFQLYEEGTGDLSKGDIQVDGKWYRPMTYLDPWSEAVDEDGEINTRLGYQYNGGDYPTTANHSVGDPIFFTTHRNGYADIHLNQERDGLALERGKQYYLYEVVTPSGFAKEDIFWSFIIDDMDYFDSVNRIYVYRDDGVLTVSNSSADEGLVIPSADEGLVIRKDVTGSNPPPWSMQKDITFDIVGVDLDTNQIVLSSTVTYNEFIKDHNDGSWRVKLRPEEMPQGASAYAYTITERNADVDTHTRTTTVTTQHENDQIQTPAIDNTAPSVTVIITAADLTSRAPVRVWFDNRYDARDVNLSVTKNWGTRAAGKTDKSVELTLLADGEPYALWLDNGVYRPVDAGQTEALITLTEGDWNASIEGLPRYNAAGRLITWSIRETKVSYRSGTDVIEAVGEDIDLQFVTTAQTVTGVDGNGDPVTASVSVSHAEAAFDLSGRQNGNLTLTNELAELKTVRVNKVWLDENGDDVTLSKTDDDAVTFDLYRTTAELPKGGGARMTMNVIPRSNDAATIETPTIDIKEGDELDIYLTSLQPTTASWDPAIVSIINFGGLLMQTKYIGTPVEYEGVTYPQRWAYAFPVTGVYNLSGEDIAWYDTVGRNPEGNEAYHKMIVRNHFAFNSNTLVRTNDLASTWVSYRSIYMTIVIRVRAENLDWRANNNYNLQVRTSAPCSIRIVNHTQETENLNRASLLQLVADNNLEPYRENLTMNASDLWQYINSLPQDDGNGNEYTYFVIEHQVAGYSDGYAIDEQGNITITNTEVAPTPENVGNLTVTKAVEGASTGGKTFRFTVKNGGKYLVQKADNSGYALMTLAQAVAEESNGGVYRYSLTDAGSITLSGLLPGTYDVAELGTEAGGDAQLAGYTLVTQTSGRGHITVQKGQTASCTITNSYTPLVTQMSFGKLWVGSGENNAVPAEWPEDEGIAVMLQRRSGGVTDTDFRMVYVLRMGASGMEAELQRLLSTGYPTDGDGNCTVGFTALNPGSYHHYRFTFTGLDQCVLSGANAGSFWEYYLTEPTTSGSYTVSYGGVNGTTAAPESGKTDAVGTALAEPTLTDTQYVINQYSNRSVTFDKIWFGQDRTQELTVWPTHTVVIPAAEEGADPTVTVEDVPITIHIQRRLQYEKNGQTLLSEAYDSYVVDLENLTSASTARAQNTAEGRVTMTMTQTGGRFRFTVSGLKERGTMLIDGDTVSGEWIYYVTEGAVDGYSTQYFNGDGTARTEYFTPSGGSVQNTLKLGRLIVSKETSGLPTAESDKLFYFVVTKEGQYLKADGTMTPMLTPHALRSGERIIINDVAPGDYTVTELGTGDGEDAQIIGYTLAATGSGTVTLENDGQSSVVLRNEYTLKTVDFRFDKLWLPLADDPTPDALQSWPAGTTIRFTLHRAVAGSEDDSFLLVYSVTEKNGNLSYTLDMERSTWSDTGFEPGLDLLGGANNVYGFRLIDLPQTVTTGANAGADWIYYLTESKPDNYTQYYGEAAENGGVWQAVIDPSAQSTATDGAVINRQTAISVSVTKLWFTNADWNTPVAWPKGANGKDVPITITVGSNQNGATQRSWTVTSAKPAADAGYTMTRQGNNYVFTFNGLQPGFDYVLTETQVDGYFTAYVLENGTRQQSGMHWTDDGGTIRNTVESFELPHTGGFGRMLLPIFGGALTVLSAAGALSGRRSKRRRRNGSPI